MLKRRATAAVGPVAVGIDDLRLYLHDLRAIVYQQRLGAGLCIPRLTPLDNRRHCLAIDWVLIGSRLLGHHLAA